MTEHGGERDFRTMARSLRERRQRILRARYDELMAREDKGDELTPHELQMLEYDLERESAFEEFVRRHPVAVGLGLGAAIAAFGVFFGVMMFLIARHAHV